MGCIAYNDINEKYQVTQRVQITCSECGHKIARFAQISGVDTIPGEFNDIDFRAKPHTCVIQ